MAMQVRVNSGFESQPPNELPMSVDRGVNIAGALVSPSSQLAPDAPAGAVRRFFYVDGAMGRPLSGDTTGPLQVRQPVEGSMSRVTTAVSCEQYHCQYVFPDVLAADAVFATGGAVPSQHAAGIYYSDGAEEPNVPTAAPHHVSNLLSQYMNAMI